MTEQPGISAWIILFTTLLATGGLAVGVLWPSRKKESSTSNLSKTPEPQTLQEESSQG